MGQYTLDVYIMTIMVESVSKPSLQDMRIKDDGMNVRPHVFGYC